MANVPVDPATGGAEIVGTDVFLLNGLVELFYGALTMLPTFFGPPSLQSITGSGATITPSAVEPVSGDAFIAVPVPATTATPGATGASIPATTTTQPTAHSLLSPFFHPTTTPTTGSTMPQSGPVAYPWILRVPARATDLLALSAACFGGIPSLIFWARGVGRGSAEDPSARGYAVGALIYHISVPLLQIFKFTRAQAHSPSVPLSSTPSALAAAEMAATAAVQGAGRNWESAVASGVLHLGLAVGFARWLLRSYSRKPAPPIVPAGQAAAAAIPPVGQVAATSTTDIQPVVAIENPVSQDRTGTSV